MPVDFGALIAEQASAARLMMTVAQIVKHIDGSVPVRFLIAETETGYTLLAALWLARLFGIDRHIEISPLFETAEALERGAEVLDEALRSPHYRDYLQATGRLALQFGYSDSGRYVGQLAATYLIERLRLKIGETLARHGVTGVEVILFDTHGESIGRGAHPGSLADRLKYLSPTASPPGAPQRRPCGARGERLPGRRRLPAVRHPRACAGDVTRIAEQTFHPAAGPIEDPVYAEPDFSADFFATVRAAMEELVEDPGYAALLGAFGPRYSTAPARAPPARQIDGMRGSARLRHPRELRAIPTTRSCSSSAGAPTRCRASAPPPRGTRKPSPRCGEQPALPPRAGFRGARAGAFGYRGPARRDRHARPRHLARPRRAHAPARPARGLVSVARALERLDIWAAAQSMFRRIHADHLALRAAWPDAPHMAHARDPAARAAPRADPSDLAAGDRDPRFLAAPRRHPAGARGGDPAARHRARSPCWARFSRQPRTPRPIATTPSPPGPRGCRAYATEHDIFAPMRRLFALVREIATAITHEVGAFG